MPYSLLTQQFPRKETDNTPSCRSSPAPRSQSVNGCRWGLRGITNFPHGDRNGDGTWQNCTLTSFSCRCLTLLSGKLILAMTRSDFILADEEQIGLHFGLRKPSLHENCNKIGRISLGFWSACQLKWSCLLILNSSERQNWSKYLPQIHRWTY